MLQKYWKRATATIMTLALATTGSACAQDVAGNPESESPAMAKNIILFIGDGMHLEHEIAASRYLFGEDRALSFHKLPYKGAATTWDVQTYDHYAWMFGADAYDPANFNPIIGYNPEYGGEMPYPDDPDGGVGYYLNWFNPYGDSDHDKDDAGRPATDSASSGTAMATGTKTDSGNIGWETGDPEGGALKSIGELMREQRGSLFAVASSVPFTHATPASFASHGTSRYDYPELGDSMLLEVRPDVAIGGGHPRFYKGEAEPNYTFLAEEAYQRFANSENDDYVFVERKPDADGAEALAKAFETARGEDKKLFGLFGGADSHFETPKASDDGSASVANAAEENPLLHEVVTQTLGYLREEDADKGFFAMFEQGDIDWANHDNDYASMIGATWGLHKAVQAAVDFVEQPGDNIDWDNTLLIVTADHANSYMRLTGDPVLGKGELPEQVAAGDESEAERREAEEGFVGDWFYPGGEVQYGTGGHTNEPVSVYAKGAAAERFHNYEGAWYPGTKLIDNTQLFKVMAEAAQVTASE